MATQTRGDFHLFLLSFKNTFIQWFSTLWRGLESPGKLVEIEQSWAFVFLPSSQMVLRPPKVWELLLWARLPFYLFLGLPVLFHSFLLSIGSPVLMPRPCLLSYPFCISRCLLSSCLVPSQLRYCARHELESPTTMELPASPGHTYSHEVQEIKLGGEHTDRGRLLPHWEVGLGKADLVNEQQPTGKGRERGSSRFLRR